MLAGEAVAGKAAESFSLQLPVPFKDFWRMRLSSKEETKLGHRKKSLVIGIEEGGWSSLKDWRDVG